MAKTDPSVSDPARQRFLILQLVRLAGVALGVLGALILAEVVLWPVLVGYVLLALGAFDVFILPQILVRRWRTPQ